MAELNQFVILIFKDYNSVYDIGPDDNDIDSDKVSHTCNLSGQ